MNCPPPWPRGHVSQSRGTGARLKTELELPGGPGVQGRDIARPGNGLCLDTFELQRC